MRRHSAAVAAAPVAVVVACLGLLVSVPAALARATTAGQGTGGTAQEVPGTAALNQGGNAEVESLSCAAAGSCSGGGYYTDRHGYLQAFVVGETNGTWGTARKVPGTAALNRGGNAVVEAVSCTSAGNCSAGGYYVDAAGALQVFVVGQTNGTWGTARKVNGMAALNKGGAAEITAISCASAGNCSAGGYYADASDAFQAFVVGEKDGTWLTAQEVPGTAALNKGELAEVDSLSCAAPGDCSASGDYSSTPPAFGEAFVATEKNGTWGKAEEVPGTAALNRGGDAEAAAVSCGSVGNCSAGGDYASTRFKDQSFVVNEKNGEWGRAREVPGTAALNPGGDGGILALSCPSAGNCGGVGVYGTAADALGVFVVTETKGVWGPAEEAPGSAALNKGGLAELPSVSCASAGNCSAGGWYEARDGHIQVFVISQQNGRWGRAEEVPGTAALNKGTPANLDTMSCGAPGNCGAGGSYKDGHRHLQAFVVNQTQRSRTRSQPPR